jgi:transcription elongation factor Elf1
MIFGAIMGIGVSAIGSKTPQEKSQLYEVPFECPYCKKGVRETRNVKVSSVEADVPSLKCPICGNVSVVDWQP